MNKIGFEKEYILRNSKGELVVQPSKYGFETDNLGVLVEVRGEPADTVEKALANLLAKEMMAKAKAEAHKYSLVEESNVKLSDAEILKITDVYHEMLHDKMEDAKKDKSSSVADFKVSVLTAGLHIHFSKEKPREIPTTTVNTKITIFSPKIKDVEVQKETTTEKITEVVIVNTFIDMPKIISTLDKEFKDEILAANRTLGAYEIKTYGFEYRSLPNTVSLGKVAGICSKLFLSM